MRASLHLTLVSAAILLFVRPGTGHSTPGSGADPALSSGFPAELTERQARPPAAWSVDGVIGYVTGGPGNDLMDAMWASGFGDELCWLWCVSYPTKDANIVLFKNPPFWVAARHRLGRGPFQVGLAGGASGLGEVRGYDGYTPPGPLPFRVFYLTTDSKVSILAAMAWFEFLPGIWKWSLRIGAGPSLNLASVGFEQSGGWSSFCRSNARTPPQQVGWDLQEPSREIRPADRPGVTQEKLDSAGRHMRRFHLDLYRRS